MTHQSIIPILLHNATRRDLTENLLCTHLSWLPVVFNQILKPCNCIKVWISHHIRWDAPDERPLSKCVSCLIRKLLRLGLWLHSRILSHLHLVSDFYFPPNLIPFNRILIFSESHKSTSRYITNYLGSSYTKKGISSENKFHHRYLKKEPTELLIMLITSRMRNSVEDHEELTPRSR